jgi:hypothetical protein
MPKPDFIDQLRRRLVELGCPLGRLRRLVREVADHREDLQQAARREGASEADAEARANAQLGDPRELAGHLMTVVRRSSWWGRHGFIAFCLLPLAVVPVLWAWLVVMNVLLGFALGFGWDFNKLHAAEDNPATFPQVAMGVQGADGLAMALVALLFCWLARRSAVSFKWMGIACGICSLYALFFNVQIQPQTHFFSLGASWTSPWAALFWSLHWGRAAIPLLMAGAVYAWRRGRETKARLFLGS